eukprot:2233210-Pyramimonas_sp.AAC.1
MMDLWAKIWEAMDSRSGAVELLWTKARATTSLREAWGLSEAEYVLNACADHFVGVAAAEGE